MDGLQELIGYDGKMKQRCETEGLISLADQPPSI